MVHGFGLCVGRQSSSLHLELWANMRSNVHQVIKLPLFYQHISLLSYRLCGSLQERLYMCAGSCCNMRQLTLSSLLPIVNCATSTNAHVYGPRCQKRVVGCVLPVFVEHTPAPRDVLGQVSSLHRPDSGCCVVQFAPSGHLLVDVVTLDVNSLPSYLKI